MTTSVKVFGGQQPTEEHLQEVRQVAKREPIHDKDAPELSLEQLQRYRKAAIAKREKAVVTIGLAREDMDKTCFLGIAIEPC